MDRIEPLIEGVCVDLRRTFQLDPTHPSSRSERTVIAQSEEATCTGFDLKQNFDLIRIQICNCYNFQTTRPNLANFISMNSGAQALDNHALSLVNSICYLV